MSQIDIRVTEKVLLFVVVQLGLDRIRGWATTRIHPAVLDHRDCASDGQIWLLHFR